MIFHRIVVMLLLLSAYLSPAWAAEPKLNPFDFDLKPAIWKLADEDTTIYMFGTIHLLPRDLKWRTDKLNAIMEEVNTLVVETSDADFNEADGEEALVSSMMENVGGPPLIDRVQPENRDTLKELATFIEMPLEALDLMPAWVIPFFVYFKSIEEAEESGEYGYAFGVETVLEAEFKKMKKPILSIEEPTAILSALTNMPDEQQMDFVNQMLTEWRTNGVEAIAFPTEQKKVDGKAVTALDYSDDIAWAKGDLSVAEVGLTKDDLGEGFYQILITDRNAAWTEWLVDRMEKPGKILLAVGTGHFAGDDALLKMLEEKGLTADRIQ